VPGGVAANQTNGRLCRPGRALHVNSIFGAAKPLPGGVAAISTNGALCAPGGFALESATKQEIRRRT